MCVKQVAVLLLVLVNFIFAVSLTLHLTSASIGLMQRIYTVEPTSWYLAVHGLGLSHVTATRCLALSLYMFAQLVWLDLL